jgi:hypothetical protein
MDKRGRLKASIGEQVPGGSDTHVQFNDGGAFGGDADLTWNKSTEKLGIAGDVNWGAGGGLLFGEIYAKDNAVETAIAVAGTYVQIAIFDTNGQSNGATPDHTNDHITIDTAGIYLVIASIHVESIGAGAADVVGIDVRKNNGTVTFDNLHAHRKLAGGGGDIGSISVSGIISLSAADTLEVWIANEDNNTNLVVEDIAFSIICIGG